MDDEKPETRHLKLKPKEITLTDPRSVAGDGTAISVQLIHRENQLAEAKSKKGTRNGLEVPAPGSRAPALAPVFKPKDIVPTDAPATPDDEDAISVPGILLENRIAEHKSGWGRIKRRKRRKSKRDRDFVLTVGGLDLFIAILMKVLPSTITMIYGIAAITLVTSTTAWIMYVVNDDY